MNEGYYIYVCLECGKQSRSPGSHHVAGDDVCSNGADHEKIGQPKLSRIAVSIVDDGTRSHLFRMRARAEERVKEWQGKRSVAVGERAA